VGQMLHAEVLCFELQRKRIFNPVSNMFTKQRQVNIPMQHLPLLTWGEMCFVGVEKKKTLDTSVVRSTELKAVVCAFYCKTPALSTESL